MEVVRWGEARGIVQNGSAISQAIKTLEETTELLDALNRKNLADTRDAIGDVVVTLLMVCAILDINLTDCLKDAYEEIKDRKGYLTPEGTFIKEIQ
jgi:NTP pyrophosphatase (non-canonical NTP hydrolase)